MWYKVGKVSINKGSTILTGNGTTWADNKMGIGAGDIVLIPGSGTVQMYEIKKVVSNTSIELDTAFTGNNVANGAYAIVTVVTESLPDFAKRISATLAYYQKEMDDLSKFASAGVADIDFTLPDGTVKKIPSVAKLQKQVTDEVARSKTAGDALKKTVDTAVAGIDTKISTKLDKTNPVVNGTVQTDRVIFNGTPVRDIAGDAKKALGFHIEGPDANWKSMPTPSGLGVLITYKLNDLRHVQFAIGSGNTHFYLRSLRTDQTGTEAWDKVFTHKAPPTASQVGALTDATATGKFVQKSIKINGKPLSSDVNLTAGDMNAYNKTETYKKAEVFSRGESDSRYMKTAMLESLADVAWNKPFGMYRQQNTGDSHLVFNMSGNGGSTPTAQLRFKYNQAGMWYRSAQDAKGFPSGWTQVYTEKFKPTPAAIGALPVESPQVNGLLWVKSTDVNKPSVGIGDNDSGFGPNGDGSFSIWCNHKKMGTVDVARIHYPQFSTSNADAIRMTQGGRSVLLRNDNNAFYMLVTNSEWATWNGLRPFSFNLNSGDVSMNHHVNIGGNCQVNNWFNARGQVNVNGTIRMENTGKNSIYSSITRLWGDGGERQSVLEWDWEGGPWTAYLEFNRSLGATKFGVNGRIEGNLVNTSDVRLKKNVEKVEGALEKINKLSGYQYIWKKDDAPSAGVIAQEVLEVMPSAVGVTQNHDVESDDTDYYTVEYNQLHALHIEAIKELTKRVEKLEEQLYNSQVTIDKLVKLNNGVSEETPPVNNEETP